MTDALEVEELVAVVGLAEAGRLRTSFLSIIY